MLSPAAKAELEKQGYRIVGTHSAVKTCGWTKNMIRGEGGCYKLKFYGIMSHQCMQMTTSISCANRCTFCWRGYKAPVSKEWKWEVDTPEDIHAGAMQAHHQLLVGFGGSATANQTAYAKSKEIKHVALSLTGEPIFYPRINESLALFNHDGVSTFLVTNAQYPEQIRDLKPVTQLYVSVDAPTKEMLKEVDKPLFKDYWERLLLSLDYLAQKKQRTCVRLTVVKGENDVLLDKYAELIKRGNPDFIEAKAYMHVGPSRERLTQENMPLHEEIVSFSKALVKYLSDWEIVSEHVSSHVVMLAKKKFKLDGVWHTWIDFEKWHQLVNIDPDGKDFTSMDFLRKTPQVGLSGKGSLDSMPEEKRKRFLAEKKVLSSYGEEAYTFVDEKTEEMDFYAGKEESIEKEVTVKEEVEEEEKLVVVG